jgi:5-methylcytosine-specific restriction endonuclease McrA
MMKSLVLNADGQPHGVVHVVRAQQLIEAGKASLIHASERKLRTAGGEIVDVPSVIVLRTYYNVPKRKNSWSRKGVLKRDGYECQYCGDQLIPESKSRATQPTIDHIIPQKNGGKSTWTNTVCACHKCQKIKGSRALHETGLQLRSQPRMPRVNYLVITSKADPIWKQYIELP